MHQLQNTNVNFKHFKYDGVVAFYVNLKQCSAQNINKFSIYSQILQQCKLKKNKNPSNQPSTSSGETLCPKQVPPPLILSLSSEQVLFHFVRQHATLINKTANALTLVGYLKSAQKYVYKQEHPGKVADVLQECTYLFLFIPMENLVMK